MKKNDIKKGTIWSTSDSVEFSVTDTKEINDEIWVFYQKRKTKENYSCLKGAFLQRFFLNANHRYNDI